ncbi:MAG: SIR2 family NAD-dependent protein deacylase [Bryobacteraceae bacterium]
MTPRIPAVPDDLVDAVIQRRAVLFAGAGVSRGEVQTDLGMVEQYLPSWGGLLAVLIDRSVKTAQLTAAEAAKLRKAVKDRKYLFVAEAVRRKLGARDYDEALEEIFRDSRLKPTKRHALLTQIPWTAIVTTNYDKLIESAYAVKGAIPPTYTFGDSPDLISAVSHNRFFVLKAHGDIDRKDTVVLSERDYRDLVYRSPGYRAALNTLFITRTVLFVGAALTDTDVTLVLESVSESFGGKGPHHYALLPTREAGDAESDHWRDFFGIRLLQYTASKGHPEVDGFLEQLKARVEERLASG